MAMAVSTSPRFDAGPDCADEVDRGCSLVDSRTSITEHVMLLQTERKSSRSTRECIVTCDGDGAE
jgi:hypothetical protein